MNKYFRIQIKYNYTIREKSRVRRVFYGEWIHKICVNFEVLYDMNLKLQMIVEYAKSMEKLCHLFCSKCKGEKKEKI